MTRVAYICDRQDPDCKGHCGYPVCTHTTNISHAVNFIRVSEGVYIENDVDGDQIIMDVEDKESPDN